MSFRPENFFSNLNGVSFGTASQTRVTASVAAGGAQTHTAGTTNTAAGLSFSDANGVSFGLAGQTITASVAAGAAQTHTAGTTNTAAGLSFANGGGVSFGLDGQTITATVAAQSVQPGIQSISAGTTRATTGEVIWSNANGISFGLDAGTVTATYYRPVVSNALQDVGTATNAGTNTSRFAADDHVHRGVIGVVPNATASTFYGFVNLSAGNLMSLASGGVSTAGSLQVINLLSSSAIAQPVSSASAAGALVSRYALADHAHAGLNSVSVVGNTAGATTAGAGSLVLAGGPNVTLSCGTAAGGMTVSVSAAAAGAGAAPVVSRFPLPWGNVGWATSAPVYSGGTGATGGSTQATLSGVVHPFPLPFDLQVSRIHAISSVSATVAGTGSYTHGYCLGLYTLNANTLSLAHSWKFVHEMSQNSVTARTHRFYWGTNSTSNSSQLSGNSSASFSGQRAFPLANVATTIGASNYYLGEIFFHRSSSVNLYSVLNLAYASGSQTTGASYLGESSTTNRYGWCGVFSTTTNGTDQFRFLVMPASIHTSALTGNSTSQWRVPYFEAWRSTT